MTPTAATDTVKLCRELWPGYRQEEVKGWTPVLERAFAQRLIKLDIDYEQAEARLTEYAVGHNAPGTPGNLLALLAELIPEGQRVVNQPRGEAARKADAPLSTPESRCRIVCELAEQGNTFAQAFLASRGIDWHGDPLVAIAKWKGASS